MKIIVDENITYGREAFSTLGEVITLSGREITNEVCKDADALIVRSITNVNKKLLEGTNVKFAATATIGLDHFDEEYLKSAGIAYTNSPGCNRFAVNDYVMSGLAFLANRDGWKFKDKSIGVIGVGNIGRIVARHAEIRGMKPLLNDPPRERAERKGNFVSLEEVLDADIITLHVPLNMEGEDKTFHLIDDKILRRLKPGTILINSCRGAVVDNNALLDRLKEKNDLITVLDVWENEPNINEELLELVDLGTAHIAGYSFEGKVNGTEMTYLALCEFLDVKPTWKPVWPEIPDREINLTEYVSKEKNLKQIYDVIYRIEDDSDLLKKEGPAGFDKLRKTYKFRREFHNYDVW